MSCGENSNGGCGGGCGKITTYKLLGKCGIEHIKNLLNGKIFTVWGSLRVAAHLPLHLVKSYEETTTVVEGWVEEASVDDEGNYSAGVMSAADKEALDGLKESVSGLTEADEKLDERVTALEDGAETTNSKVEALEGASGEHTTQIEALEEAVGKIDLSNYVKNTDFVSTSADGILSKEDYEELYNLYDTVFIACRLESRQEEDEISLVLPSAVAAGHFSNRTPCGIAVVQDNRLFIVALDESAEPIAWSSGYGLVGEALSTSTEAVVDNDGEAETAAIIAASKEGFITNTDDYAAGFCHNYGNDMFPAGNWYLPSMYELLVIKKNLRAINYALGLVGGTPIRYENLQGQAYWASSEKSDGQAWQLNMYESHLVTNDKVEGKYYVRPITAMKTERSVIYSLVATLSYNSGDDIPSTGGTYTPNLNVLRCEQQETVRNFTELSEGDYEVTYTIMASSSIFTLSGGVLTVAENVSGSRQFAMIIANITSTAPDKTSLSVTASTSVYCVG